MHSTRQADYLIIGGGVIGLSVARELKSRFPAARILIIEKESTLAFHGSGRNSGVLHAGFYYSADSLKARFCREGNAQMTAYVKQHGLRFNPCQKVVVATNEEERQTIHELKHRGDANGVEVEIVDEKRLAEIDPNARSFGEALHSPSTSTIDPIEICQHLGKALMERGVGILLAHPYLRRTGENTVLAGDLEITFGRLFNCAGLYADRIARDFGFCKDYTIIPFKGIHLKASRPPNPSVRTLIYPVPNLKNPFLGVHFNLTVGGEVRIGPTAIPAFWRENYRRLERFKPDELLSIAFWELKLMATNAFGFRELAISELRKYSRTHLLDLVRPMVQQLDEKAFTQWARPGIRAQLLHKKTLSLVQDFVVEGDARSIHVLNAVSPAFTCSLPFGKWVVDNHG